MIARLDNFDLQILALVQLNNLATHREIAERVSLSVPAVARRLQRLRSDGVICKDVSVLQPEKVGNRLTIIVDVAVENEAVAQLDAIMKRFADCLQVQQCYYVTGETDFILILSVRDMEEYETLTHSLFFDAGNVKHFRTAVSMRRVKMSLAIPVTALEGTN
jgi:Lrp/AsnC family leucine-responsive transcriptional regulator